VSEDVNRFHCHVGVSGEPLGGLRLVEKTNIFVPKPPAVLRGYRQGRDNRAIMIVEAPGSRLSMARSFKLQNDMNQGYSQARMV